MEFDLADSLEDSVDRFEYQLRPVTPADGFGVANDGTDYATAEE